MALDVGGLVDVPVVVTHVAPVDPAHGHDLAGAEDLALRGHAVTTTRDLVAASLRSPAAPLVEFLDRGRWRTVYSSKGSPGLAPGRAGMPVGHVRVRGVVAGSGARARGSGSPEGDRLCARVLGAGSAPVGSPQWRWAQTHGEACITRSTGTFTAG
jgi:hypothetical protein